MPSVNLAPGTQYLLQVKRRQRRLLLLAVGIAVLAGLAWGGAVLYQRNLEQQLQGVEGRIRSVEMEIAELDDAADRIVLFEGRLLTLNSLLDRHITWDVLLQNLEELLPADTVLGSVNVQSDRGALEVQGVTPNIDSIAVALASLKTDQERQTVFESGKVVGITREASETPDGEVNVRYRFSAEFSFSPTILRSGS